MFRDKTVFVLGAGSSVELNLPDGRTLADDIAGNLKFPGPRDNWQQEHARLFDFARNMGHGDWIEIGRTIALGLPAAASIDNFVSAHIDNENLVRLAKGAIVNRILRAEQNSYLYSAHNRNWNDRKVYASWLGPFFHRLVEGVNRADVADIFQNVSLINFNYDRCVEHFLTQALARYFNIRLDEAYDVVDTLTIHRPYGRIAKYILSPNPSIGLCFGQERDIGVLSKAYQNIKTFSEKAPAQSELDASRSEIRNATAVVFLGLAFHEPNMNFFCLAANDEPKTDFERPAVKRVYATLYGMEDPDAEFVREELARRIFVGYPPYHSNSGKVYASNQWTCKLLLRANQKSI